MFGRSRRSGTDVAARVESLEAAVALADGRLDPDHVAFARSVIDKGRRRLRHGTHHTVAAMLGPTGGGKSSLVNALAGSDIATAGVRRPTTSSTLACIWPGADAESGEDAGPLLDWLGVENRHLVATEPGSALDGLVLLDVPDHDSVAVAHRLEMERIAEHVDLLIWVTDPEKYADKAFHDYLRYLAGHQAVTLVVLNKSDQLEPAELTQCRQDLSRLLVADGIGGATVMTASAVTGDGIDDLRSLLGSTVAERVAALVRIQGDVAVAASELAADAGVGSGQAGGVKGSARRTLAAELVDATGIEAVSEAVVATTRRDARAVMGWPFTRWTRRFRPDPLRRLNLDRNSAGRSSLPAASTTQILRADGAIRTFADGLTADLDEPWPSAVREAATPEREVLSDRLDAAVADAVRNHRPGRPRWWSIVGALQWLAAAATLVGLVWLTVLFALAWLQVPDPPTPEWRGWPVPTLLLLGGVAVGLVLSVLARRIGVLSARRAGRRVRTAAIAAVEDLADELVVAPAQTELEVRAQLLGHLEASGADPRLVASDTAAAG